MRADTAEIAQIDASLKPKVGMSLEALYYQHQGKVADKWSAYLREYDRILSEYRHRPVRLLEIGVQNGGSLEVWADYFKQAKAIVGCDINPRCEDLRYEDPRISVVVEDANSDEGQRRILEQAPKLEIVIDDGSHRSGDIVHSFVRYFPHIVDGGVFIAEDLHCSYWQEFEGGLFHPHSSMTFLKRLADVINHEHWGVPRLRADLVQGILNHYGLSVHEQELGRIHSIEFSNSFCVIRKAPTDANVLGERVIVGTEESVMDGILALQGMARPEPEDQRKNGWSAASLPPEQEVLELRAAVAPLGATRARVDALQKEHAATAEVVESLRSQADARAQQVQALSEELQRVQQERASWQSALSDRERQLAALAQELATMVSGRAKDRRVAGRERDALQQTLSQREAELRKSRNELSKLQQSISWRVTGPLRDAASLGDRLGPPGGYYRATRRVRKVLRDKGLLGATKRALELATGRAELSPPPPTTPRPASLKKSGKPKFDRTNYDEWLKKHETLTPEERVGMAARAAAFARQPLISIVLPTYNPDLKWLGEAIDSVRRQIYCNWELCIVDDASSNAAVRSFLEAQAANDPRVRVCFRDQNGHISLATNSGFDMARGEWIALLDHDDLLQEQALYWVVDAINKHDQVRLIYSDEDKVLAGGHRRGPYFKPDWNPDLFLSHNMICHLGVYHADLVRDVGGCRKGFEGAQDYDLALRCVERLENSQIHHIPRVLYSWRIHPESTASTGDAKPYAALAGKRALDEHFARTGVRAEAELEPSVSYRTRYEMPSKEPLVSIIIPTRNAEELVRQCVESITQRTKYQQYEILLVDNGSNDPAAQRYFSKLAHDGTVRLLRDDRAFNYSALNNAAAAQARGEFLCLLNNDIEVISEDWLRELVSIALQRGVGAVGARLWYPNDTLQHAGVVLGIGGVAGHAHKGFPKENRGYFGRAALIQSYSAVTGACLLVRKALFDEVGGLNEADLKVAFNDVDFCLRLRERGYRNVWTPYAELYHHESATRGYEDNPEKIERFEREQRYMKARWGRLLKNDPAYNPNLSLEHQDFSLAWPPRVAT